MQLLHTFDYVINIEAWGSIIIQGFLWEILWGRWFGDHPQDLTKFSYW
jgi:hypothetical protein